MIISRLQDVTFLCDITHLPGIALPHNDSHLANSCKLILCDLQDLHMEGKVFWRRLNPGGYRIGWNLDWRSLYQRMIVLGFASMIVCPRSGLRCGGPIDCGRQSINRIIMLAINPAFFLGGAIKWQNLGIQREEKINIKL